MESPYKGVTIALPDATRLTQIPALGIGSCSWSCCPVRSQELQASANSFGYLTARSYYQKTPWTWVQRDQAGPHLETSSLLVSFHNTRKSYTHSRKRHEVTSWEPFKLTVDGQAGTIVARMSREKSTLLWFAHENLTLRIAALSRTLPN